MTLIVGVWEKYKGNNTQITLFISYYGKKDGTLQKSLDVLASLNYSFGHLGFIKYTIFSFPGYGRNG